MTTGHERVREWRALAEAEKVALLCNQEYRLHAYQKRVEALTCAHETGDCVSCRDKDQTIEELQQNVKDLRARLYGKSSEKRKHHKVKRPKPPSGQDDQKSPQRRKRLPTEQYPEARIEVQTVSAECSPDCPDCQAQMTDSGLREVSERLELSPMELFIVRQERVRYHCKACQSAPATAPLPARLAPQTSLNDSVLIEASIAKFYDLIPTQRFAKMLARSQVNIAHTLLLSAQQTLAQLFTEAYAAVRAEVLSARVLHADETPHRMLERNEGKQQWYLWCFASAQAVYFEIQHTRSSEISIEVLKDSQAAYLLSDVYTGYIKTVKEVNVWRESKGLPLLQSAFCQDHARRYFFKAQGHPQAEAVLDLYGQIYEIESQVQLLLKHPTTEARDSALSLRRSMDPLFEQIYDIAAEILMNESTESTIGQGARYFLNHQPGLTLFLSDLDIPISNAFAERSIRNPVVGRKTWLGTHSRKGAETAAIHFSLLESCRLNAVNPREYYNHLAKLKLSGASLITPAQFKQFRSNAPPN